MRRARSGSPYEERYGFSRAIRLDGRVLVAGTAPVWSDGSCPDDASEQARRCFEIGLEALGELGGAVEDVVRTRMYIVDPDDADAVGGVHGELFGAVRPVATMVVVKQLLDPRWRVEIEMEAHAGGDRAASGRASGARG